MNYLIKEESLMAFYKNANIPTRAEYAREIFYNLPAKITIPKGLIPEEYDNVIISGFDETRGRIKVHVMLTYTHVRYDDVSDMLILTSSKVEALEQ